MTHTKSDGTYRLDSMKAGSYKIEVVSDQIYYDPVTFTITPRSANLPDIIAARFVRLLCFCILYNFLILDNLFGIIRFCLS